MYVARKSARDTAARSLRDTPQKIPRLISQVFISEVPIYNDCKEFTYESESKPG